ncbi:hypothetical protein [Capillimicrobium parvum]|uniref:Uncharacterized protein n=1 Tax=Capillimicrobium parvum TaxID=2884022 RepID=A0A9E7C0B6_9ACTN|nr:hypothetical protein [Capillimicrobium parvum]UGS35367.1 hypothetical protein DSM104329_01755 [Capillimicrobium parvum]
MSQPARAHEPWADDLDTSYPSRRGRREAVSWASAEDLEILGGLGRDPSSNWTVLTLDRDDDPAPDAAWVDETGTGPASAGFDETGTGPASARFDEPAPATRPLRGRFRRAEPIRPRAAADRESPVRLIDHETTPIDYISEPPPPLLPGQRRTVVIRGIVPAPVAVTPPDRRRPPSRTRDRVGRRPDRVALWAFVLGLLLIVIAVLSTGGSA